MKSLRFLAAFVIAHSASAHPADQSEMRVRPTPHKLEIRLTFNILTLSRFVGIDTDEDMKISLEELKAAQAGIATYLNQHIHVEINRKKALLGTGVQFKPLWPDAEQTAPMTEPEYAVRNMDVTFVQTIDGQVLEDFWLGFEIFEQTGPMQTIRGVYEQDGRIEEVPFSVQQPEYLYDTGFGEDPFVQEAEKKAKGGKPAMADEEPPARPAAMLAGASPYAEAGTAAPTGTAATLGGGMPVASVAAGAPAGNLAVKLAAPITPQVAPTASSTERWWFVRAVVLIILLVVGRKIQLNARNQAARPRRRSRPR